MESNKRFFIVVGGNWNEYLHWCDRHGERPQGGRARYIDHPMRLMGIVAADCELVFTGTCYTRHEFHDLLDQLNACGFSRDEILNKLYGTPASATPDDGSDRRSDGEGGEE